MDTRQAINIFVPVKEIDSSYDGGIKIDESLLRDVVGDDEKPEFVLAEVEEGKSNNNIIYDRQAFEKIAMQVNEKVPVGYLGHEHFTGTAKEDLVPDPQTVWLGATVATEGGKAIFRAKGYNLPESKVRKGQWIKRKAIGSVSWSGDAILTPVKEGGYRIREFVLESIDWSRKNREGLKKQRLSLVTEMEGGKRVTAEEIANLQYVELNSNNPGLVHSIKEMQKAEDDEKLKAELADQKDKLEEKHQKEIETNPEISMMQKIKEVLNIKDGENALDSLVSLLEKLDSVQRSMVKSWFEDELLPKKVPNEKARRLIARMIPVTEMQGNWKDEKGIEKIKTSIEERVDDALDHDDDIKAVITEMGSDRGGLNLRHQKSRTENNNDGKNENENIEEVEVAFT